MNEQKTNTYDKPLQTLALILVLIFTYLVFIYFPNRPKLSYDPNVEETGEYLSVEETIFVTDTYKDDMGDRYLLSCKLNKTPKKTNKGYMYSFVDDLRKYGRQFVLISDELLPTGDYLQLDGLISGYYYVKYQNNSPYAGSFFTVLKVTGITKTGQKRIDFAAPIERTEEPNCSVSQQGITFSLDKIEYRGPLSRVFLTLELPEDRQLIQYDLCISCEGKNLSGNFVGTVYDPPRELTYYCSPQDIELLPFICKTRSVYNGIMLIRTPEPGKPIDITYSYYDYTMEEISENGLQLNEDTIHTIELSYQPENPAVE